MSPVQFLKTPPGIVTPPLQPVPVLDKPLEKEFFLSAKKNIIGIIEIIEDTEDKSDIIKDVGGKSQIILWTFTLDNIVDY